MNYEMEDLKARYIGARTQDNEQLDDQKAMLDAQKKDDEVIAQQVAQKAEEQAPALTDEQKGKINGDTPKLEPDMGFEIPTAEMEFTGDREGEVIDPEETTLKTVGAVTKDIISNAPKNISLGIVKGAKNAVDAVAPGFLEAADTELETMFPGYVEETNKFFNETLAGASTSDKVVQEMSSFMFPFGAYMKMLGATTKMGTISKGFAADALTSFYNVDPHLERLSSVAVEMGIENELVAYMADQTGTETENRFRNVLENQAIGGAFVAAAKTLKATWWAGREMKAQHDKVGTEEFLLGPVEQRERGSVSMKQAKEQGFKGDAPDEAVEWNNAVDKGLDMSQEGRMTRAKDMGFDTNTTMYHGTDADFSEFKLDRSKSWGDAIFVTEDAELAGSYGGRTLPLYVNKADTLETTSTIDFVRALKDKTTSDKYAAISVADTSEMGNPIQQTVIFQPERIRSVHAAFDPAMKKSGKILAGVTGAAVASAPDEAEAGLLDTIRARNAALNEASGIDGDVATQEEMPEDPRSEAQILGSLPDDIYLEWNQTTPIKEWLWITHPELLQGNGEA